MPLYNLTNFTAINSTVEQLQWVNTELTGGLFGILIVIALFAILIMRLMYYNFSVAFLAASFMTATLSIFIWLLDLIPTYALIIVMILPMVGVIIVYLTNE